MRRTEQDEDMERAAEQIDDHVRAWHPARLPRDRLPRDRVAGCDAERTARGRARGIWVRLCPTFPPARSPCCLTKPESTLIRGT